MIYHFSGMLPEFSDWTPSGSITVKGKMFRTLFIIFLFSQTHIIFAQNVPFIIKAARLIDGRGGAPLEPAMVRIQGDKIAEVGAQLVIPKGAKVIDLGNATLLPGLIDLHTHLTDRYGTHWEEALVKTTPGHNALWGAHNARVTLLQRAGFVMKGVVVYRDDLLKR